MTESSNSTVAETVPLLRPTARPRSPSTAAVARALHAHPASLLSVLVPLLLAVPCVLFLLRSTPTAVIHPGIAASSPIHLSVPHVPLSFLALGDWGRKGKYGQRVVADALARTVHNTLVTRGYNPHYIISTGDNFYKTGVESVDDDHFNSSYLDIYDQVALSNVPWYSILGNHDHLGSIHAQVEFTARDPRWNMPATYYAQRFADNLVAIFLDTTPFVNTKYGYVARNVNNQSPQPQMRWLKRQLANSPSTAYFIIVGHHNLYTMSTAGHLGSTELRDSIEPILMPYRHRILAYVSGHEHALMHMQPYSVETLAEGVDKPVAPFSPVVDHFISGAGSKIDDIKVPSPEERQHWQDCCGVLPLTSDSSVPRTVWGESVHGFFAFRFDGRLFSANAIDDTGKVVYSYEKTVA